ncbi:MAG: NADH-quinone oxidoreductase subunit NuoE family protein [Planctomycetota bacterium]|jgi:NADH:ubiquinone oxidoreductase subunit E
MKTNDGQIESTAINTNDGPNDNGPSDKDVWGLWGQVLVCGGGIAGIQASLDLSAAGFSVYLVEQSPTIGGGMARLDKTFPTNDCATCIISPKLVECMRDLNVEVLTMSDVVELDGQAGHFHATVLQRPRGVNADKCTSCGDCWEHCPVRNLPEVPDAYRPSGPLDQEDQSVLNGILARYQSDPGLLMPVLQDINEHYGYLPRLMLEHVSAHLEMPLAQIIRVASFYQEFRLEPAGRHIIEICSGTSCYARGSAALLESIENHIGIKAGETDKDNRFTLQTVRCLGLCALSPSLRIDGVNFGRVNPDSVSKILERYK